MERDIRILLVDDSPDGAYLIEHQLNNSGLSFRMTVVREENEFRNALEQFQPGVILCDHSLPAFNSIEALDIAKEFERKKNISVFVFTAAFRTYTSANRQRKH